MNFGKLKNYAQRNFKKTFWAKTVRYLKKFLEKPAVKLLLESLFFLLCDLRVLCRLITAWFVIDTVRFWQINRKILETQFRLLQWNVHESMLHDYEKQNFMITMMIRYFHESMVTSDKKNKVFLVIHYSMRHFFVEAVWDHIEKMDHGSMLMRVLWSLLCSKMLNIIRCHYYSDNSFNKNKHSI